MTVNSIPLSGFRWAREKLFEFATPLCNVQYNLINDFRLCCLTSSLLSSASAICCTCIYIKNIIIKYYCFVGFVCAVVPVLKQTIEDQENIADFDDDIAAEVAAAVATAKLPVITIQPPTGSPQHSGVPDFGPPPSLKKNNITTNPSLETRGANNNNNSYNSLADNNDHGPSLLGIICIIAVFCIFSMSILMAIVLKIIIHKYHVLRNFKG